MVSRAIFDGAILAGAILDVPILDTGIRIERFSPFVEIDWDFLSSLAKDNLSRFKKRYMEVSNDAE